MRPESNGSYRCRKCGAEGSGSWYTVEHVVLRCSVYINNYHSSLEHDDAYEQVDSGCEEEYCKCDECGYAGTKLSDVFTTNTDTIKNLSPRIAVKRMVGHDDWRKTLKEYEPLEDET